ncbi:hypothetical protein [Desulfosarcina ovata]|uniref:Uncharacterized protein n=1 Tax=Desulfosarcina ovata subsp. ovata TaxID=2752305 RepID=A0A5K8A4Y9_9BACT|nr:hypothetical protein [Desulfosarcina ovata]BBO87612.1 hypothetical protein DSCOOX_07920 [Desulfosarcina ovata subsp. ovata]
MKTLNKIEHDENMALEAQLTERIEELIERLLLETAFDFLNRMLENKKNIRTPVCYRSDCHGRDKIPF